MSPQLTAIKHQQRHARTRPARFHFSWNAIGSVRITAIMLVVTFALGGVYVSLLNKSSVEGFALKDLEQRVEELELENDRLHYQASALSSLSKIEQFAEAQDMIRGESITYLPDVGSTVAAR
ncbi:MAG: hypothetical protein WCV86_02920 [Patescibacteria group bacterium]|jgi:cell division protein FtsL